MNSKNPEMQQHNFLKFVSFFFFNSTQQTQHFVLSPKSSALTEGTNQCLVCLTKGSINTSLCTWIFKCTSLFISFQSHSSPALGMKHTSWELKVSAQRDPEVMRSSLHPPKNSEGPRRALRWWDHHFIPPKLSIPWEHSQLSRAWTAREEGERILLVCPSLLPWTEQLLEWGKKASRLNV